MKRLLRDGLSEDPRLGCVALVLANLGAAYLLAGQEGQATATEHDRIAMAMFEALGMRPWPPEGD